MKKVAILVILMFLSIANTVMAETNNQILLDEVQFLPQSPPGDWSFNSNCGPTAALIISSYLLDFQPSVDHLKQAVDWLYENQYIVPQTSNGAEHYDGNLTNMGQLKKLLEDHWQTGFVIKRNSCDLEKVRQELEKDNPVMVAVHVNMNTFKIGHFMVVIGMTDEEVIVHDPGRTAGQFNRYSLDAFVNSWRKASNCASLFVEEQVITWHPDGALISSVNDSDVYVLIDGKKSLIDSDQVFDAHDFPRDMVIEVSDLELSCYDDGFIVDWQPVREVFQVEDGTILLYEKNSSDSSHCALYEFSSEFAYRTWTIDERLQVLTDQQAEDQYFWRCDLMDTLYVRDGTLVKPNYPISGFGHGVVFVATGNGRLRAFSTEQAYNEMGYAGKYLYHANQDELEGSFRLFDPDITLEMAHRCLNSYYITGGSYDENEMDMDNDGYTVNKGDCDDADPLMHPGATESCNGLDDNCNSFTDEGKLCPDGLICLGLAGCFYQEAFADQDLVESEPEPEELEEEIEPEQDPCQGVSHCLRCQAEQDCYAFDSCDGNSQVSFSGHCLYEGYCHREIIPCQFGCQIGICHIPQQPDQDQVENEAEVEMEPDLPEEQDNRPDMDDLVTCTFTCPSDMQAYAWYASFGEAIGSPSVTVNSPLRDICLRGHPWIDFNCACLYPSLWSCYDHTVATIECNLPFDRRAGGNGEGEIWFPGIQCW